MKLEGFRVIDLSLFLPGPLLTLPMADHGAEVIKIEPPGWATRSAISVTAPAVRASGSATLIAARKAWYSTSRTAEA